jgi:hypothetical protein
VIITIALLVQFADTVPLRRGMREQLNQSQPLLFRSPEWFTLGQDHANLFVFPAWQCFALASGADTPGGTDTPGGWEGSRAFGMLAAAQHMRTNSYYAGRYSPASLAFHCDQAVQDVLQKPLSTDSAYVVSPTVASMIAAGPTGPSACHTLDGFILCSTKTDFGLGPGSPPEVPMLDASDRIESLGAAVRRGYIIGGWYRPDPEVIWSKGHGVVQFRLSPEQRRRYHAVALELAVPVGAKDVHYYIRSGSHTQSGSLPGGSGPKVEGFDVQVPLQESPDSAERILLSIEDAIRPVDIGLNSDPRRLGLGVRGLRLIP